MSIKNIGRRDSGNALLYVFMAVGLLAALTYSFVKGSRENYAVQNAARIAEEMYVQVNLMKSSIMQCRMEYMGSIEETPIDVDGDGDDDAIGDLNLDDAIDSDDNANQGYPLVPTDPLTTNAAAGCNRTSNASGCIEADTSDDVRNLKCVEAPIGEANMFSGQNNTGAFLPPAPQGFGEWQYKNDANGVYLQITATSKNMTYEETLSRLEDKFVTCQAERDFDDCGENCFTAWVKRNIDCEE